MKYSRNLLLVLPLLPASLAQTTFGSYAPTVVDCPATPLLRTVTLANQTINPKEAEYIAGRAQTLPQAWNSWMGDGSILGYDLSKFSSMPKVGIAASGGGYRAAIYGAGVLSAFDARNSAAVTAGTGGMLQVASYLSSLSGGSWLTSSIFYNNFPDFRELVLGSSNKAGWLMDFDLFLPAGLDVGADNNENFFELVLSSVLSKGQKGFDTSLTDLWSRTVSYHFLGQTTRENFFTNDTSHGAGLLWSDIPQVSSFQSHSLPFPIVVADARPPGFEDQEGASNIPLNVTVYEITPYEFGSYDKSLSAFLDTKYLGTRLANGTVNGSCVNNFDQAGFMIGTSSSLFNAILYKGKNALRGFDKFQETALLGMLRKLLSQISTRADDVGNYPNPFNGINPGVYEDSASTWLDLVDGGLNKEHIPFGPLLTKARALDVIVAMDGGADDDEDWPTGVALYATRDRMEAVGNGTWQGFPPIPSDPQDFVDLGLTRRPTFFGCNPTQSPPEYPLVLYFPNAPPLNGDDPVTNAPTFKFRYTDIHTKPFLDQTFATATSGFTPFSSSPDANFGKCLQCAAVDRARLTSSSPIPRSDFCRSCFDRYCFEPANPPARGQIVGRKFKFVDPDPAGLKTFFQRNKVWIIAIVATLGGLFAIGVPVLCCIVKRKGKGVYRRVASKADA